MARAQSMKLTTTIAHQICLVFMTVIFLCGAYIILNRYFSEIPAIDELEKVSGIVQFETESKGGGNKYLVMVVGDERCKYLSWFPHADKMRALVRAGRPATIWTDKGANDWVWQIEQDDALVVRYADMRNAAASNKRFGWLLGGLMILMAGHSVFKLYRIRVRAAAASAMESAPLRDQ